MDYSEVNMNKKEKLIEKQEKQVKALSTQIINGEDELKGFQQKVTAIQKTTDNLVRELGLVDDIEVQAELAHVYDKYENTIKAVNDKLDSLDEELVTMKKNHKKELEKYK